MTTPVRVLFVEDRVSDVELMLWELRNRFEPDWRVVEREADYLAALDPGIDVILADYTLPDFGALRALELLQESGLDIPFIVVTGSISEDVAVECMRSGAADYLLKDRLTRLCPAVSQAIEQTRLRQARQRAEKERAGLLGREKAARLLAETAERRSRFLAEASVVLASSLDREAILQRLVRAIVPEFADWCAIDLLTDEGSIQQVAVAHVDPSQLERVRERRPLRPHQLDAPRGASAVLRSGEPELHREITDEILAEVAIDGRQLEMLRSLAPLSMLIVPMAARGRITGVMTLATTGRRHRFDAGDLSLAHELAQRCALAVENAILYSERASVAQTLQASLLPERLPAIPGASMAAVYRPGGDEAQVGGDWYDVLELPDDEIGLVMGDVAGRGVKAASVMGQLRSAVRAYAMEGHGPRASLELLSGLVRQYHDEGMATLAYLAVDPLGGRARFAHAGHPLPIVRAADGAVTFLTAERTLPLGVFASPEYQETELIVEPGSTVLLYTDGLIERRGESLTESMGRLSRAVRDGPADPELLCEHVIERLVPAEGTQDDVALLALAMVPVAGDRLLLELPASPTALAPMRRALKHWLAETAATPEEAFGMLVAASEAAANAVEHAYGPGDARVEVEAEVGDREVAITVRDFGRWRSPRGEHRGRGAEMMQGLTDTVDFARTAEGTSVTLRRRLAKRAGA